MRRTPATFILTLLIFAMFGYELLLGFSIPPHTVLHALSMTEEPQVLVDAGAIYGGMRPIPNSWRFLASMFIHIGWIHLLLNVVALVQIGFLLEGLFGSLFFTFSFLTTGLLEGMGSLLALGHESGDVSVMAGASGAIFGILGTLIAAMRRSPELRERYWSRGLARQLIGCASFNIVGGMIFSIVATLLHSQFNLGMSAHVIGLATGLLIGFLPVRLRESPATRELIHRFEAPRRREPMRDAPEGDERLS